MEFILAAIIRFIFRFVTINLPGGTIRWLIGGRKRPWKAYLSEDESFDNFRAVFLFVLALALTGGIVYWLYISLI
ncbi:hypothetical protein [Chitinophaga sp.]|uniref:hypothetical protein n=1 Tax=Chitinophaga sp. TaxID=1869181 RepID=UPI0026283F9D|nr:hypothetical protein [uncultured Chitinophaga sp.]